MVTEATVPGAFVCDLLPWSGYLCIPIDVVLTLAVRYLPSWVPFQKFASKGAAVVKVHVNKPFDQVVREMVVIFRPLLPVAGINFADLRRNLELRLRRSYKTYLRQEM